VRTPGRIALALGPVLVGVAILALHLFASFNALDRDVTTAKARVSSAFDRGQLTSNPYRHPSTTIGSHQWNDCLITLLSIDQRGDRARLALSPIIAGFESPELDEGDPCSSLAALTSGQALDPDLYHYDRYVHGAVVALRYLLPHFEISQIRALYRGTLTAALVCGFALCLIGIARGRRVAAFVVLAVVFLALLRFFGLEFFSQSLGHGPADLIIACYAVSIALMLFVPTGPLVVVLAAAVFGGLTIIFELFTGGVPLGLAMVLGLSSLAVRRGSQPDGIPLALWSAAGFLTSAATVYVLKLLAVVYVADDAVVADVLHKLRSYSTAAEGLDAKGAIVQIAGSVSVIVGGMTLLAWSALAGALVAGAYGAGWIRRHAPDSGTRQLATLLALSVLPIPMWLLVFINQAGTHAWFIDRILVWPIAAGYGLFVLAMATRAAGESAA
jgi:hypothetical protein